MQQRVSQHFLRHLMRQAKSTSTTEKAMLNIMVSMIMVPICSYQSVLTSVNFPKKMKLISLNLMVSV